MSKLNRKNHIVHEMNKEILVDFEWPWKTSYVLQSKGFVAFCERLCISQQTTPEKKILFSKGIEKQKSLETDKSISFVHISATVQ